MKPSELVKYWANVRKLEKLGHVNAIRERGNMHKLMKRKPKAKDR